MQFRHSAMACAIATLSLLSGSVAASGFALIEQSGSGLGNAYAGATAGAEDASTIFFNPAGMARLQGKQIVVALNLISPQSQFTDTGSVAASSGGARPLGTLPDGNRKYAWLSTGYFVMEIDPQLRFGFGVNAPFASKTEYPADWIGRYQAIKSSIETVNLNPSLSWRVNDALSLGAGLDYQRIKANMTNAVIIGAGDGTTTMEGSDAAWGYNFGGLLQLDDGARIGLSYRSSIQYNLSGTAYTAFSATIPGTTNTFIPVTSAIKTPDTWSVGYFKPLNDKWDVMTDVSLTGWHSFNELRVINAGTGATAALTQENWHDTWRVALGVNHHYSERWTVRAGLAYDEDPVPEALRTPRIPDSDRTWLSLGGQYKFAGSGALDFGYAHLFVKSTSINRNTGGVNVADTTKYAQLTGNYNSQADILSVQYSYGF